MTGKVDYTPYCGRVNTEALRRRIDRAMRDCHDIAMDAHDIVMGARDLAELCLAMEDRDQLRSCFHSACEELSAMKAALVDEGDEVPTGPALSLVEELKADRDALQRLANCRAEQRDALVTQVERLRGLSIRIYNTGYGVGHNDTVEGGYTDIHHSDMDSYHAEEVAELLLDLEVPSLTSARPGQPEGSAWSGWCCQYPGKMPRLYGTREIAELNHDPDNGDRLFQVVELHQAKEVSDD